MIAGRFLLGAAALGLLQMPSCMGMGDDEKYDEVRTIRIQMEGCKEESPLPAPTLVAVATVAVAGTSATAAVSAPPTMIALAPVTAAAVAATPLESETDAYLRKRAELNAMLDDDHLSPLDLPGVRQALAQAGASFAENRVDEAVRQIEVAETEVRLKKITFGILNAKIERLSADLEAFKGTADYAPLQKQLQDANTALTMDQKNAARDELWRLEQRLDELRSHRTGAPIRK